MVLKRNLEQLLLNRKEKGLLRKLRIIAKNKIDFSSNDYLGFSSSGILKKEIESIKKKFANNLLINTNGSGGSRLLFGNNIFFRNLEHELSLFFHSEDALLFNSGYDANIGFFSCVPQKNDFVFYDDLVHASIHDGMRLSHAKCFKFKHNDLNDLKKKIALQKIKGGSVYVSVESVYSMDGDFAALKEFSNYCKKHKYLLVVDEAHAGGIFGKNGAGMCEQLKVDCFARLYTFSKAFGAHGAVICCSKVLKNYLVNYSRPFIYSTSLPFDSLLAIKSALQLCRKTKTREVVNLNINYFQKKFTNFPGYKKSDSTIQTILIESNEKVEKVSQLLYNKGFDVRAVKSPTVKVGAERLRISLHAFNSFKEINMLCSELSLLKDLLA